MQIERKRTRVEPFRDHGGRGRCAPGRWPRDLLHWPLLLLLLREGVRVRPGLHLPQSDRLAVYVHDTLAPDVWGLWGVDTLASVLFERPPQK